MQPFVDELRRIVIPPPSYPGDTPTPLPASRDVDMVDPASIRVPSDGPPRTNVAQEAQNNALMAQMQAVMEEQRKMQRHLEMSSELRARLEANNVDKRQEVIREIHSHHVHPIQVPPAQPPPDMTPLITLVGNALANQNNNIQRVAELRTRHRACAPT